MLLLHFWWRKQLCCNHSRAAHIFRNWTPPPPVTTDLQRKPLIRTDRSIKAEISSALPLTAFPTAAKNTPHPHYAGQLLSNHPHPPSKTGDNFMTTEGRRSQQFSADTPERKIQRLVCFCLFVFYLFVSVPLRAATLLPKMLGRVPEPLGHMSRGCRPITVLQAPQHCLSALIHEVFTDCLHTCSTVGL